MRKFAVTDTVTKYDIKSIRRRLELTQGDFAELANVSKKTVERWETSDKPITGPIVTLIKLLREHPHFKERLEIPVKEYKLRVWYMNNSDVCTLIDVDERNRRVKIRNYTENRIFRAFGVEEKPTFEQYEEFLESRCFPRSRDKMKLILKDLDLPFYDPILIIEKTEGRMAEDNFWIKIERG